MGAEDRAVGDDDYQKFKIQPGRFAEANGLSYYEGCVVKRVCAYHARRDEEELRKAIHELELLLQYRGEEDDIDTEKDR